MAPGWYPDPLDQSRLRYWDGAKWTEQLSAVPPSPTSQQQNPGRPSQQPPYSGAPNSGPLGPQPPYRQPPTSGNAPQLFGGPAPQVPGQAQGGVKGWMSRHKVWTAVIASFAFFTVVGALGGSGEEDLSATESDPSVSEKRAVSASDEEAAPAESEAEPVKDEEPEKEESSGSTEEKAAPTEEQAPPAETTGEFGAYGPIETKFVEAALAARTAYESADNELQEGAALNQRNEKLCRLIPGGTVAGWQGKVITLDSNGDGYGVVELEIADDIKVATWNNAFSDIGDDTLIKPGPLYNKVLALSEGDIVSFSGRFIESGDACVNDSAMTKYGATTSPDFIFRFSDIKKVG